MTKRMTPEEKAQTAQLVSALDDLLPAASRPSRRGAARSSPPARGLSLDEYLTPTPSFSDTHLPIAVTTFWLEWTCDSCTSRWESPEFASNSTFKVYQHRRHHDRIEYRPCFGDADHAHLPHTLTVKRLSVRHCRHCFTLHPASQLPLPLAPTNGETHPLSHARQAYYSSLLTAACPPDLSTLRIPQGADETTLNLHLWGLSDLLTREGIDKLIALEDYKLRQNGAAA